MTFHGILKTLTEWHIHEKVAQWDSAFSRNWEVFRSNPSHAPKLVTNAMVNFRSCFSRLSQSERLKSGK